MLQPEKGVCMRDDVGTVLHYAKLRFPENWRGDLPPIATRDAIRDQKEREQA